MIMRSHRYQFLLLFAILSIIGLVLIPYLSVQLAPSTGKRFITVSYMWLGASPEALEREVTAPLEGAFSTLTNISKVSSVSGYNQGYITLEINHRADVDALRFEVSAMVRQVYPKLPNGIDYPQIQLNTPDEQQEVKPLLILQLSGPVSAAALQRYANEQLKPRLAATAGIGSISVYGGSMLEWMLTYNVNELVSLKLTENDLRQSVQRRFQREPLGQITSGTGQTLRVRLDNATANRSNYWSNVVVAKRGERLIYLTDLVKITQQEPPSDQYYRINGKTAVNLVLTATANTNQITTVKQVRQQLELLGVSTNYHLDIAYDATVYVRENLRKTSIQTSIAMIVLLLFVVITTRSVRYLILVIFSTIVTLLLSVVVFVWIGVEIHLYSLAALTTSLGIVMDNTIIMIDHYRRYRDLRVFTAMLGATLTTCAGLIAIWFLPGENQQVLNDYASVMLVTLFVSLVVAMLFTPTILEQFWIKPTQDGPNYQRRKWRMIRYKLFSESLYIRMLEILFRYRRIMLMIILLLFGLPVFLLPNSINPKNSFASLYKMTVGSKWYTDNLQTQVNKWLGGTFRLFVNYVYEGSYPSEPERTALYIVAELPNQSKPEQMDELFRQFESLMKQFNEIDQFITRIDNGQKGSLVVYFKKSVDEGAFPHELKNRSILLSTQMSGVTWNIFGVGQGFSQNINEQKIPTFNVEMYGYNYFQLEQQSILLKQLLEKNPRIHDINVDRSPGLFQYRQLDEFVLETDPKLLALYGVGATKLYNQLTDFNARLQTDQYAFINNDYKSINIFPIQSRDIDIRQLQNQPLKMGDVSIKLNDISKITRQRVMSEIHKQNQQYKRLVSFDYYGSYNFGEKILTQKLVELKSMMPLGYTAKTVDRFLFSDNARTPYELIWLIILLIYIICAVVFESLRKPLVLIGLIPLSYIGIFLGFYWTDSNFDQGGYASFILITGNVVYAGIFIVAEMNRLQKKYPRLTAFNTYKKAFRHKIGPLMLTIISTIVGMVPFLLYNKEPFWYALGIGTISGLLMSLLSITICLPLFLFKKSSIVNS